MLIAVDEIYGKGISLDLNPAAAGLNNYPKSIFIQLLRSCILSVIMFRRFTHPAINIQLLRSFFSVPLQILKGFNVNSSR